MLQGTIRKYSHYFSVNAHEARLRIAMQSYQTEFLIEKQLTKKRGRFRMENKRFWWRRSLRNGERAFNINEFDAFMEFMRKWGFTPEDFKVVEAIIPEADKVDLKVEGFEPWAEQVPLIDHAKGDHHQYAVTLQPGGGKTIIALFVASIFGVRFAVVTKGGYEGRWVPALYNTLGLKPEEVRSCCGAKAIVNLIGECKKKGIEAVKAVFFSIGGIRDYIKNYEAGLYEGKICEDVPPEKLYEFLGIGFRIVDEAHEEIHAHYIADLYTNIKHSLYLTGTLIPRDEFMARRYETFLPEKIRKSEDKFNVYVKAVEVFYYLNNPDEARYTGSQGSYSHTTYEQWIMKDEVRLKNWLSGVYDYIVSVWAANRVEETKIILFAATIELGGKMAEYFARRMPDLRVIQYKAGDPYDYLIDNDVIFATLGKAGTAVDIPDLEQVHLTTAIDSANAYVQAFGRLRDLIKRFPNITPEFHWYTCLSIDKQVAYGKRKRDVLKPRVLGFRSEYLSKRV